MSLDEVTITVEAKVYPTEKRERVGEAVRNIFPDAGFEYEPDEGGESGKLTAEATSADRMSELIDEREINETARDVLGDSVVGDTLVFHLSKQPAFVGRLNFDVGGHELGSLLVRIEADDTEEFVRRVTTPGV